MNKPTKEALANLAAAKAKLSKVAASVAAKKITGAADATDALMCAEHAETLRTKRSNAVAAAKSADVVRIDGLLLRAQVTAEIATVRAQKSAQAHAEAVVALADAEAAVSAAARRVVDAELVQMAEAFEAALDHALDLGEQLQAAAADNPLHRPLNMPHAVVPAAVTTALEKMPLLNPYDVPLNVLRGDGIHEDKRAARLAQLIA